MATVFLTGATGFVGRHLARHLAEAGLEVRALVRDPQKAEVLAGLPSVTCVRGDVLQPETLAAGMASCDAVIHLVGIIRETQQVNFRHAHVTSTANLVTATKEQGIKRFIQMSALGTRPNAVADYHRTKYLGEQIVRNSGLNWTIFRPSVIYGEGSEFIKSMMELVRGPITPIISPGMDTGLLQPIHIDDLTTCFVQAAQDNTGRTFGQTYDCGGPDRLTTEQIIDTLVEVANKKLRKIRLPLALANLALGTGERLGLPVPATPGQLTMLQEHNVCDLAGMRRAFGIEPRPFRTGLAPLAKWIRTFA